MRYLEVNTHTGLIFALLLFSFSAWSADCPSGERRLQPSEDCIPRHLYLYLYCLNRSNNGLLSVKQTGVTSLGKNYEIKVGGKVSGLVLSGDANADISHASKSSVGLALEKQISPDLAKYCRELASETNNDGTEADLLLEYHRRGENYFFGINGVHKDYSEAAKWFRKAAEKGYPFSQSNLGHMYDKGLGGLPQSYSTAVAWYEKAAAQGEEYGQVSLGNSYEHGEGVPQSDSVAVYWYQKASNQGYARGQKCLGVMYFNGRGVPENHAIALSLFRKSAAQGNAEALYFLGWMYERGQGGLAKSAADALHWYRKAAEAGNTDAQEEVKRLTRR